jgi:hypothetical protein
MLIKNRKCQLSLFADLTKPSIFFLLACLLMSSTFSAYAETTKKVERIRIQDLEKINDPIATYIVEILALAIKKSGEAYIIEKLSGETIPQVRQIVDMSQNRGQLDVIWTMTSDEREREILPIRVPIDKGFFGWRIAFVNGDQSNLLHSVKTQADLAKFKAGQGYLWPDTEIMRSNGLPVVTGSDETLANMLTAKRFDYFPRPIIAIWNEQKNQKDFSKFAIDTTFVLHYPTAFYFFVAPKQTKLAADLTRGLERAVADGSFDLVFNKYFRSYIQQADINNRVIFELNNPLIKANSLPLDKAKYWFHPEAKNTKIKH